MLGLDNAGKTTILKKLSDEDITTITPTQVQGAAPRGPPLPMQPGRGAPNVVSWHAAPRRAST